MAWFSSLFLSSDVLSDIQARVYQIREYMISTHDRVQKLERTLMATLDALQAAVERNGAAVGNAVVALVDQREKIAKLQAAVEAGTVDTDRLAAITASIDASSDAVAQALAPVVQDPDTDTGDVSEPPQTNPETAQPEEIPGAVPAGEPLSNQ